MPRGVTIPSSEQQLFVRIAGAFILYLKDANWFSPICLLDIIPSMAECLSTAAIPEGSRILILNGYSKPFVPFTM